MAGSGSMNWRNVRRSRDSSMQYRMPIVLLTRDSCIANETLQSNRV